MSLKKSNRQRGAALVEFALGFMFFLLLTVGLLELARGVWTYTTVAHATRQAARYAHVHGASNPASSTDIETVVATHAIGLDSSKLQVTTTWTPSNQPGATVQVQVRYPFELVSGSLISNDKTIQVGATSRMIVAN